MELAKRFKLLVSGSVLFIFASLTFLMVHSAMGDNNSNTKHLYSFIN